MPIRAHRLRNIPQGGIIPRRVRSYLTGSSRRFYDPPPFHSQRLSTTIKNHPVAPDSAQPVEEFYQPLYRFALSLSRNHSDAGDLVQQTFYIWAAKGHQLREKSKVKTWLFTTLYRTFLAQRRRDERFVTTEDESEFVEPQHIPASIVNALDGAIVQDALQNLDERYRAPVTLFYLQQHSYREIAEILEIPIGTVMSRISRGKAALREGLSDAAAAAGRKIVQMEGEPSHG